MNSRNVRPDTGPSEGELEMMLARTSPNLFAGGTARGAFLLRLLDTRRILAALRRRPAEACLVVVQDEISLLQVGLRAIGHGLTVGRGENTDWCVADRQRRLSARHFSVARRGSDYLLKDLNSTNGVRLNENPKRIKACRLRDGDFIHAGGCVFLFLSGADAM